MNTRLLHTYVAARIVVAELADRAASERGEGVISTAIAVLIMALLGGAMWLAFKGIFDGATGRVGGAVDGIGG